MIALLYTNGIVVLC